MGIRVKGARENNLKSVNVEFQPGLTVVTGVSGSGKTSLVFETLYHEARRRFDEVFQFGSVGQRLTPAQVDSITGIGPAVAVGQNLLNRNPNSTLATASGLHPFLRLLFARFGVRACSNCGEPIGVFSEDEMIAQSAHINMENTVSIQAPLLREAVGSHRSLLRLFAREFGEESLLVDGQSYNGEHLDPAEKHSVTLILGELEKDAPRQVIREKVQQARALGATVINVESEEGNEKYSTARVCSNCGTWFTELEPKDFHSTTSEKIANVTWMNQSINELQKLDVDTAYELFKDSPLQIQSERLYSEIIKRLESLRRVGLGYITLDRPSPSLSRGESQRVRLAISLTRDHKSSRLRAWTGKSRAREKPSTE